MLQACSRQNHSNANMVALATRYQQIKLQGLHGTRKIANSITFNGTIEGQKLIFKHKKKYLVPKSCIKQVQDRMFSTTNVDVNWTPIPV